MTIDKVLLTPPNVWAQLFVARTSHFTMLRHRIAFRLTGHNAVPSGAPPLELQHQIG